MVCGDVCEVEVAQGECPHIPAVFRRIEVVALVKPDGSIGADQPEKVRTHSIITVVVLVDVFYLNILPSLHAEVARWVLGKALHKGQILDREFYRHRVGSQHPFGALSVYRIVNLGGHAEYWAFYPLNTITRDIEHWSASSSLSDYFKFSSFVWIAL